MTMIICGDRAVALNKVNKLKPIQMIHRTPGDSDLSVSVVNPENYLLWTQQNRIHMVWMDPHPNWDPKYLKPSPGRHVIFTGAISAKWKKWAKDHKIETIDAALPSHEKRMFMLTSGKAGLRFTQEAADIMCHGFPGSYDALY